MSLQSLFFGIFGEITNRIIAVVIGCLPINTHYIIIRIYTACYELWFLNKMLNNYLFGRYPG